MKTTKNIDIYFPGITSELNLNIVKDSNMKRHIVSCHCNNTSSIGYVLIDEKKQNLMEMFYLELYIQCTYKQLLR